jgi:hypothetical protein
MWSLPLTRVAGLVCFSGLVAACGTTVASHPIAAVTKSVAPVPVVASPPATGRLTQPFDEGYGPKDYSLGNYRMDPAPGSTRPRMTPQQVLNALYRSSDASFAREAGAHVITRFGLFSGFDARAKNGNYGPTRAVIRRPAWLVVISGVPMTSLGGPAPAPGHTRPPETPGPGWTLIVIYDDTGQPQSIVTQQGADPHIT